MVVVKTGAWRTISACMRVLKSDEYEWLHRGRGKLTLFGSAARIFCDVKENVAKIMALCSGNRKNVTSSFDANREVKYGHPGVTCADLCAGVS